MIVFCVNDGAVMNAWGKDQGIGGSMVKFLADPRAEVTRALGMELTHEGPTYKLGARCKRFAMFVDDGAIKAVCVSESAEDPAGDDHPEATCAENMMKEVACVLKVPPPSGTTESKTDVVSAGPAEGTSAWRPQF